MPRLKTHLFKAHLAWTKIPNLVLDRLLPTLKDTELRILLVLLRQTVGWNRPDSTVILSYRRLKETTGRESEAISNALNSLSKKGLIHIQGRRSDRKSKLYKPLSEEQQ